MALILKNMKASGANVKINPDEFIRQLKDTSLPDVLSELKDENVKYEQWKKVAMPDGKKRTKINEKEETRENFIAIAYAQVQDFKEHVSRVQLQYAALNNLKQNLPVGQAIIQMDFAENFSCCSADEVQSAYWNSSAVTLHPVVIYLKGETGELEHKNYVFISDDLGHNFGTVFAILQKLIVEVKSHVKNLEVVHYWTDSPSSQYRNKTAFFVVSDHKSLFGCEAIWNFFESGHGKGPCDGIGRTSKRTADLAIRQGKITIQDSHEYFERVQQYHTSAQYIFISSDECTESRSKLSEVNKLINPLKGTMQVHSVVGVSKGIIKTSITSCYCQDCLRGCFHEYSVANLMKSTRQNEVMEKETADTPRTETEEIALGQDEIIEIINVNIEKDVFVATIYDKAWHVGKITDTDEEDGECEVTFMRPSTAKSTGKTTYKWPNPEDKLWLHVSDILCNKREPTKIGRSGRSFEIHPDNNETAGGLLEDRLKS